MIEDYEGLKSSPTRGFLKDLTEFKTTALKIEPLWARTTSIALLSCFTPYCEIETDESFTAINLDFENLSPSGVGKSKPLNSVDKPILRLAGPLMGDKDLIVPSSFSKEGMVTAYNEKIEGANFPNRLMNYKQFGGLMHIDEASRLHRAVSRDSGYESDLAEFLSVVYDGWLEKRSTNAKGLQEDRPIFCNTIITGTPKAVFRIWKKNDNGDIWFDQGFGNRILYVYNSERPERQLQPYERTSYEDHKDRLTSFVDDLVKLYRANITKIRVSDDQHELVVNTETNLLKYADSLENESDLYASYFYRQKVNIYKLAAHHCISRNFYEIVKKDITEFNADGRFLDLSDHDIYWAIGQVVLYWEQLRAMIKDWKKSPTTRKAYETYDEYFDKITSILSEEKFMSEQALSKASKLEWKVFKNVIETMVRNGDVYTISRLDMTEEIRQGLGIKTKACTVYSLEPFDNGKREATQ